MDKWLRRYEQNTETRRSRKVVKNVKRGNKAKFDQIPYNLVDITDDAMINTVHQHVMEAHDMLENSEMTDVMVGQKYIQLADMVVRGI